MTFDLGFVARATTTLVCDGVRYRPTTNTGGATRRREGNTGLFNDGYCLHLFVSTIGGVVWCINVRNHAPPPSPFLLKAPKLVEEYGVCHLSTGKEGIHKFSSLVKRTRLVSHGQTQPGL